MCFLVPKCLIIEARAKDVPVGIIDLDLVLIKTINTDRGYSVDYLEYCLKKYAKKKFEMFVHNCGVHWIAFIVIPKWGRRSCTSTPIEAGRQI